MIRERWALRAVAGLFVGLGLACCLPSEEERAAAEAKEKEEIAAREARLKAFLAVLETVRADLPAVAGEDPVPCDDTKIAALHSTAPGSFVQDDALLVRAERLDALQKGPFAAEPEGAEKSWAFQDDDLFGRLLGNHATASDREKKEDLRFVGEYLEKHASVLVVWKQVERGWPKITSEGGTFTDGTFDGGYWAGWLAVYDAKTGARLCQATFTAESSDELTWDDHGVGKETPQSAANADWEKQFEKAAEAAVGSISKQVDVNL